jgi:pimeloyl-ACP methyl ester carboxylesterase
VILSGVLKKPVGEGPFPAVALVHGSGPGTREQYESIARFFVHMGLAVLSYDKRGCGASTGDWKAVDLEALADDAVAGVSWLGTNSAIDPGRVGLWGISQGGWIAPLAAARSDKVAFVINHSGPGTSLRRQDTYMMENELRDKGISPDGIDLVIAGMNTLYDYGQKRATAQQLDAEIEKLRGKPGLEEFAGYSSAMLIPDSLYKYQKLGDPAWFFHLDPDRDALEPYRRLRCPLLIVYGRLDYTVPVEESEEKIAAVLRESGNPDYTIEVLDRAGHGTIVMNKEDRQKPVEPLSIVPEYFDLLEGWLRERGLVGW